MSTPWDALATLLQTAEPDVNVYPAPVEDIVADAIVIRPDTPWFEQGEQTWYDQERYAVVALVSASAPADGLARLHDLVHSILHTARDASYEFESVTAPVVDESTGTPFLAATVSLVYRNCEEVS